MATIPKGSKIDFYKMVPTTGGTSTTKSDPLVRAQIKNISAVNNLGKTVNSIGRVVVDIKKVTHASLTAQQKKKVKFDPKYNEPKKRRTIFKFLGDIKRGKVPGFLESLLGMLAGLIKLFVILPILKWLSDKKNQKLIETGLTMLGHVFKAIAAWAKFGVLNSLDGLYNMLRDDATWMERLAGFGQFLVGFGSLVLGFRWLNPLNIIRTFGELKTILTFFKDGIVMAAKDFKTLAATPFGALLAGGLIFSAGSWLAELFPWMVNDQEAKTDKAVKEDFGGNKDDAIAALEKQLAELNWFDRHVRGMGSEIEEQIHYLKTGQTKKYGFANGGYINGYAQGGWIHGPQSGYPVSLDGKGVSFIGHGSEYVARDGGGRAFVVPFDTPATRRNSNLTTQRLSEAKRGGFSLGGLEKAVGGMVDRRILLDWTQSRYNYRDKGNYNTVFQGNGNRIQHRDYNTAPDISLAIAAMGGKPWIDYPPTMGQLEGMMKESARLALGWGLEAKDVTDKNVLTGAEAAGKSGPVAWGGTGQEMGLFKLRKGDADGSGGNKLRSMMRKYMNQPGKSQLGEKASAGAELDLLQRLVLAEARGEGELGMALVARSVLNRRELIKMGGNPGLFGATGHSLTDIIHARNQYQPVRTGSINTNWSEAQKKSAIRAIALAKSTNALRGKLRAAGYDETTINKLIGATGFRGTNAFEDKSQNVNRTRFGNHIFNMSGNKKGFDLLPESKTSGGGESSSGTSWIDRARQSLGFGRKTSSSDWGGGAGGPNVRGISGGGGGGMRGPSMMGGVSKGAGAQDIKKQTDERNRARREMNRKTLEIVQQAMAAVDKQNQGSRSWVQQANAIAQQVLSQADTPTVIGSGGGSSGPFTSGKANSIFGTAVGLLNSFNNPLKGIFR